MIRAVCITKDERIVISGSEDHKIKLWDLIDSNKNRVIGDNFGMGLALNLSRGD